MSQFRHSFQSQSAFQPTHLLLSRTRQIPVRLIPTAQGADLVTEDEWSSGSAPAFSLHAKRGFFCHEVQVLGFSLQPLSVQADSASERESVAV